MSNTGGAIPRRKLKVEVTREDILDGKREDGYSCPIARAIRRLGFAYVSVGHCTVSVGSPGLGGDLPQEATDFICKFDEEGAVGVAPFSFEVEVEVFHAE